MFCQNHDISWEVRGERVTPQRLAQMMLEFQDKGCHNINFVTPEHVVPQILEAMPHAIDAGLRLPIVYNTSSYDSLDSLALMDGIVDIYMPDAKVWSRERARRFLRMPDYPEVMRATIPEMSRQVGKLTLDHDGLAVRGLLVRHLVMPGMFDETAEILRWIADTLGADTYVDLMAQYYPAGLVGRSDVRDRVFNMARLEERTPCKQRVRPREGEPAEEYILRAMREDGGYIIRGSDLVPPVKGSGKRFHRGRFGAVARR